jgi:hypothetical protein
MLQSDRMGLVSVIFSVLRRGLGHAGELWLFTQVLQNVEPFGAVNRTIETNLLGYWLLMTAGTALIELCLLVTNPKLTAACIDDSPMLPLEEVEK